MPVTRRLGLRGSTAPATKPEKAAEAGIVSTTFYAMSNGHCRPAKGPPPCRLGAGRKLELARELRVTRTPSRCNRTAM